MSQALEFFEIVLPRCANTFGVAPCTASIPTTGDAKCFNCLATCQDTDHFVETTVTLRFAKPTSYLPRDIDIVGPWIKSIEHTSATISLAENTGTRSVLKVTLEDHKHSDAGEGLDKYQSERGYDPYDRGTFWPRFRARYPSLTGFECAWIVGEVGQSIDDMERRTFFVESGPSGDGAVTITAKDALKFLDGDRAQMPVLSEGSLLANISDSVTSLTLSPDGDGYDATGYVRIAGKEDAQFWRDASAGNDANCLLLLHMNGTNGSTTFTDSSSFARTMTAVGNAQISTARSKFLGSSGLFDGSGDYVSTPDNAAWTFAGDFTLEALVYPTSLATNWSIVCHSTDGSNGWRFLALTNGGLLFQNIAAGVTTLNAASSTGVVVTNAWQHVAVVRNGSTFTFYVNGVAVGTASSAAAITNFTGTLKIGITIDGASWSALGNMNGVRISNTARWTAAFTPPVGPYSTSSAILALVRGQLGTTASSHSAGDRVQMVKHYASVAAADIIADAITGYTDLPSDYIPLAEWQLEDSTNLGTLYTFTLGEPTSVSAFVSRVLEQCSGMMWDDALAKQLRFRVIKPVPPAADIISEANVINKTFEPTDQPEARVSRAWVYFGINDPTKRREDLDNYRQSSKAPHDATAETSEALYGSQAIRKIMADGIAIGGGSVAQRVGNLLVGRKQRPPRRFKWSMLRGSGLPVLGGGYYLDWRSLQDASGAREQVPVQVISEKVSAAIRQYVAEEMRFTDLDTGSSTDRVLLINFDGFNLNLRAIHDLTYPSTFVGVTVTFIISATVGSTSTAVPAIVVGDWPLGFTPKIILSGRIAGKGGAGAAGGLFTNGPNGSPGGTGLFTRPPIDLDVSTGKIFSGGGGGGGGGGNVFSAGGGGGGGGGKNPGAGGLDGYGNASGTDGTETAGGTGGPGAPAAGGNGGAPGFAGSPGGNATLPGGSGGPAGAAIDGISYVNVIAGPGDIRGSQIN